MGSKKMLEEKILRAMEDMRIVDHHDHLYEPFLPNLDHEIDLPYFLASNGYLSWSFVGAGMKDIFADRSDRFAYLKKPCTRDESAERWKEMKEGLKYVKNTVDYRYLILALRDLYGFEDEELNDDNWQEISSKIRDKSRNYSGWAKLLLDKMKVFKVNLDLFGAMPNKEIIQDDRLVQVVRMNDFFEGNLEAIESLTGEKVHSLDQYLAALDEDFKAVVKAGAVGIKIGLRSWYESINVGNLNFEEVLKPISEKIFKKGLKDISRLERRTFQNFMIHAVCERCAEYGLPLQIHTGPLGAYHSHTESPVRLANLFRKYPNVKFDIFHGSYPYVRELGLLAKSFPHVYVDACWLHFLSPPAFKQALSEWIEVVPSNKIFVWGGDNYLIEHSYATLILAKRLVAEVMASKISSGNLSKKVALDLTERIMGENAISVYGYK